jgi:hypothetical protein
LIWVGDAFRQLMSSLKMELVSSIWDKQETRLGIFQCEVKLKIQGFEAAGSLAKFVKCDAKMKMQNSGLIYVIPQV